MTFYGSFLHIFGHKMNLKADDEFKAFMIRAVLFLFHKTCLKYAKLRTFRVLMISIETGKNQNSFEDNVE